MREPTQSEITTEARRDNDFFAAKNRLEQQFAEAERTVQKLKPVASETDDAPWRMEPSADQILTEAKTFSLTPEDARASLKKKLAADARRLAAFSPTATAEISEALQAAETARELAENLLREHEATLSAVTNGIFRVGKLRQKIAVVKSLCLNADGEKQIANAALNFFVETKTGFASTETASGFRAMAEDLVFRLALNDHVAGFIAPLEKEATKLVAEVREQAASAKMDLKRLMAQLAAERGKRAGAELLHDQTFYAGLI